MVAALDLELVNFALAEIGDEQLPDAGCAPVPHRMAAAIPVVEVAGHADALGIGGPDGEVNSSKTFVGAQVGTQPLIVPQVRAFSQEVKVEVGQHRSEPVRVDDFPLMPLVVLDLKAVHKRLWPVGEDEPDKARPGAADPSQQAFRARPASRSTTQAVRASGRNARITHCFTSSVPPGTS